MLADDVVVWSDGGGKARAAPRPVVGVLRAARWLVNVSKRTPRGAVVRDMTLNGQPGFVIEASGEVVTALVLDIIDGQVSGVRAVTNPEKLSAVQAHLAPPG